MVSHVSNCSIHHDVLNVAINNNNAIESSTTIFGGLLGWGRIGWIYQNVPYNNIIT